MNDILIQLARRIEQKKYGKYRATVIDNQDPQKRGRLKLQIPSILGDQPSDWALPCFPFGGDRHGMFMVPLVNAQVWVEFEEGDIDRPIWTGAFWQDGAAVPPDAALADPTTRLFQTPCGHILQFDDKQGDERIRLFHKSNAEMNIDRNGTISITDAQGSAIVLDAQNTTLSIEDANGNSITMASSGLIIEDANGNKIEMAGSGVKVQAQQIVLEGTQIALGGSGGEPVIKGQSFLTLFCTHVHPTAMGPSGPPVPQGEMATLSMKVMTV